MPSFAGSHSSRLRLQAVLIAIALAAFAGSVLLSFASVTVPRAIVRTQQAASHATVTALPAVPRTVSAPAAVVKPPQDRPAPMWRLLMPFALTVDAIAVVGLLVALRVWRR